MAEDEKESTGVLEVSPGNKSAMRAGLFLCIVNAMALSWFVILKGDPAGVGLYLVALFLITGIGGKGLQAFAENIRKN